MPSERTIISARAKARVAALALALALLPAGGSGQEPAADGGGAGPGDAPATAAAPGAGEADPAGPAPADEPAPVDPADAEIAAILGARFTQLEGLRGVEVSVRAGVVTLAGTALGFHDAERAVEIAERTDGVVAVEDRIRIETGVEERVRPALERAAERLQDLVSYLPLLLVALGVVGLFVFVSRLVGRWQAPFSRVSSNAFLRDLVRQIVQATIVVAGVLIALELLDATALVGAVLGAAGVFGLAVGFAFRDLVENYIASVLLSVRQPFAPNDHVRIGEHEGKVVRLTSRATILMTLDGNHLRLPNSDVFKGVILNYSRNPKRRFHFDVGVGVDVDLLEAQRLGVEQLQGLAGVLDDPEPEAVITGLGDSNVVIRFFGWVDQTTASFAKVRAEAIRRVKVTLESAGMDLPEPIVRVMLRRPSGEPPRGRPRPLEAVDPGDLAAGEAVDDQIAEERAQAEGPRDLLDPRAPQE